jgi:hypothetical protein
MMETLKIIWQLPQNLIGKIVLKVTKAQYVSSYKDANIFVWHRVGGISLGKYIFVPQTVNEDYIKHEYGHTIQSKYLGWFYLLVIGLPSLIWAGCCGAYRKKNNVSYYDFYTEKWADKLGGVERSNR